MSWSSRVRTMWEPILLKKWQNIPLWHKDYFELNALKKMAGARRMLWPQPPPPAPPHPILPKAKDKTLLKWKMPSIPYQEETFFISGARGWDGVFCTNKPCKNNSCLYSFLTVVSLCSPNIWALRFCQFEESSFSCGRLHVHEKIMCFLLL